MFVDCLVLKMDKAIIPSHHLQCSNPLENNKRGIPYGIPLFVKERMGFEPTVRY